MTSPLGRLVSRATFSTTIFPATNKRVLSRTRVVATRKLQLGSSAPSARKTLQQRASTKNIRRCFSADAGVARPTVKILFGSQTGNATLLGNQLAKQARDRGWEADLIDLHEFDHVNELPKTDLVVFVTSCFGRGEPTDNARDFFDWLTKSDKTSADLSKLKFSVFGLGSSAYSPDRYQGKQQTVHSLMGAIYSAVGRTIDRRLEELGATRLCPRGEGDDAHSVDDDFEEWCPTFWEHMSAAFTEETGTTLDATLDNPKQVSTAETPSEPHLTWVSEAERKKKPPGVYRTADPTVIDIRNPHTSTIAAADQLHTNFSDRSAKHLSFDYSQVAGLGGTSYAPGDYLGVYPTNQDSLVEEIAQYLSLDLDAEFELTETGMKEVATKLPFFFPRPCSVRGALKYYCDLTKPPRRALISMMIKHANGADAERLAQLLAGNKEDFERALSFKTLVDILREFPSVQLNIEELLELTPALQCRYYSISSSPLVQPTTIDLTVVRHRFVSPFDRSRAMLGLCSSFLNSVAVGDTVRTFVKPTLFKLPKNPASHIIMIGAGTGLAPFRGFIQEREGLRTKFPSDPHGDNLLFFGCMDRKKDFIYGDDILDWSKRGIIRFIPAYSHEQEERIFVQHKMMEHSASLWEFINAPDTHIFICGAKPMGDAVHEALVQIVIKEGGLSREASEAYLRNLSNAYKYQADVFD